jgi:hypothetical protein
MSPVFVEIQAQHGFRTDRVLPESMNLQVIHSPLTRFDYAVSGASRGNEPGKNRNQQKAEYSRSGSLLVLRGWQSVPRDDRSHWWCGRSILLQHLPSLGSS